MSRKGELRSKEGFEVGHFEKRGPFPRTASPHRWVHSFGNRVKSGIGKLVVGKQSGQWETSVRPAVAQKI